MRVFLVSLLFVAMSSATLAQQSTKLSAGEIEQRVRAMKKADVVWRKIAWKTCLIDALHASKEQRKPIIAWVFIDRPKDDERC